MAPAEAWAPSWACTGSSGEICCSTNRTAVNAIRIATTAANRDTTKTFTALARLHQVAQAVSRDVADQSQNQGAQARQHRNPPVLEEITEVSRRVGTQLRCRGRLAQPEERQRGQREDQRADVQAGGDQRVGDGAGQQMPCRQPNSANPRQLRGLDMGTGGG